MDVALLDGTFYSPDELPGRVLTSIPHPLIESSMALLEERVRESELEVSFTHLNHSNPALLPGSAARQEVERRGFDVLEEGREIPL